MGILLIVVLIAVILIIQYYVAERFEEVAFLKGYDESMHCFAMCFWLGIVGYLYVIALPVKEKRNSDSEKEADAKAEEADDDSTIAKEDID